MDQQHNFLEAIHNAENCKSPFAIKLFKSTNLNLLITRISKSVFILEIYGSDRGYYGRGITIPVQASCYYSPNVGFYNIKNIEFDCMEILNNAFIFESTD